MLDANGFPIEEAPAEVTPEGAPLVVDGAPEAAPVEEVLAEEDARLKAEALKAAREEEDARLKAEAEALAAARTAEAALPHTPEQQAALATARAAQDEQLKADAEALAKSRAEEDAKAEPVVILSGNCGGELELLPVTAGVTYHEYKCKECGQLVHVGHEEMETIGLPTQHHKLEEEKK